MPSRSIEVRLSVALAACALSAGLGGCGEDKVHAAVPVTAAPAPADAARPMNTAPDTDSSPPVETVAAPPALPTVSTSPAPVTIPSAKPAAPRKPAGQPPVEVETPAHTAPPPQISPQLSPSDQASYERRIGDDSSVAEKNLAETNGKQLNAAQQDLVGKIRSFLTQSREASKGGDWARAQNLAQKARLLSVELVNSL